MIIVIKKDYTVVYPEEQNSLLDQGLFDTFEEAHQKVYATRHWGCDLSVSFINNGTNFTEINRETGEVLAEYLVREVGD